MLLSYAIYNENNFNRQKVDFSRRKVLERASDVANSCRRRTFNVSFSRFARESNSWCRKTFYAEEEWKLKKAGKLSLSSSFVVLSLTLGKPFVVSYCCTARMCDGCKPVLDLPIAFL